MVGNEFLMCLVLFDFWCVLYFLIISKKLFLQRNGNTANKVCFFLAFKQSAWLFSDLLLALFGFLLNFLSGIVLEHWSFLTFHGLWNYKKGQSGNPALAITMHCDATISQNTCGRCHDCWRPMLPLLMFSEKFLMSVVLATNLMLTGLLFLFSIFTLFLWKWIRFMIFKFFSSIYHPRAFVYRSNLKKSLSMRWE